MPDFQEALARPAGANGIEIGTGFVLLLRNLELCKDLGYRVASFDKFVQKEPEVFFSAGAVVAPSEDSCGLRMHD